MNRKMRRAAKQQAGRDADSTTRPSQNRIESHAAAGVAQLFAEGVRCQQSGQLVEAVGLYDRILSLKPDLPEVHCNRGVALVGLGRLEDAEAAYCQAIALNPDFADAYNNLGIALCERGVDLIEWPIASAGQIRPVGGPPPGYCAQAGVSRCLQ